MKIVLVNFVSMPADILKTREWFLTDAYFDTDSYINSLRPSDAYMRR